jgi:hypothetical protein
MPCLHKPVQGERGQYESLGHRQALRQHKKTAPVPPVGHNAGERAEYEGRYLPGKTDDAEHQRRVRHAVYQPTHRDMLHPRSDQRDALASEEQPEVAVTQSAEHASHAGAFFWFHFINRPASP